MSQSPGEMYAIAITMSIIPITAVAVRFYVRIKYKHSLGTDDWLMIPALISALGTAAAMIYAIPQGGLGLHTPIEPDGAPDYTESTENYLKADFVTLLTQVVTFGCTKLAVLFFQKRIFRGRIFVICLWTLVALVVMWTIGNFFASLFECTPIEANWVGNGLSSTCINEFPFYTSGSWSDVVLDLLILALPIPLIWKLQLSTQRKLAVSGVFLMGALTVMASIARLVSQYTIQASLSTDAGADITWLIAPTFYWPVIESALGILGACLPVMWPLFTDMSLNSIIRSWRSRKSAGSSTGSYGTVPAEKRSKGSAASESHANATSDRSFSKNTKRSNSDEYPLRGLDGSRKDGIVVEHTFDVV